MDYTFEIVFKKLEEAKKEIESVEKEAGQAEIDEIATLRKIVLETTDVESNSYTSD